MKIALNLSVSASPRERYALAWAGPVALVALAGLVYLLSSGVSSYRDYRNFHRSLAELQELEGRLRYREAQLRQELNRPQSKEVYRQAQFINSLIDKKHFSLTDLAVKVSKFLPAQVRLMGLSLSHQPEGPLVRFTVAGNSQEAVEDFLGSLEDSPDFKDVAILNQGLEQPDNPAGTVNVTCSARYLGEGVGREGQ
jgi:hypothetical protein